MSRWWRAHDEAVDDPKLQRLPGELFKAWFNLCCLTSRNGGTLPPIGDVAFKLRTTEAKAAAVIDKLRALGLIDDCDDHITMHNWSGRQFKSDVTDPTNAERQKRYRDRYRNAQKTVTDTVTVTPPRDREQNTEAEKEGKNARERASPAFDEFWEIYPNKIGKGAASKSFEKAIKSGSTTVENLMVGLHRYVNKTDDRPWCNPATWLNQKRWDDQPAQQNGAQNGKRSFSAEADKRIASARASERTLDLGPADYIDSGYGTGKEFGR